MVGSFHRFNQLLQGIQQNDVTGGQSIFRPQGDSVTACCARTAWPDRNALPYSQKNPPGELSTGRDL
jgi:hypothetical protein